MKHWNRCLVAVILVALFGCRTTEAATDYDSSVNFSLLKTYQWESSRQKVSTDLDLQIKQAVEQEFTKKGYIKIEDGKPDFLIKYNAAVESKMEVSTLQDYGVRTSQLSHTRFAGVKQTVSARQYDEGTLLISAIDPATQKPIWQGDMQAEVNKNKKAEARNKRIKKAVRKILKRFPPK
jgi:hypothetical protein